MKISIVTPTFNRADYLAATIESIVSQKGDFELEYIVQDGGSGREVLEILERWQARIAAGDFRPGCRQLQFSYFSEPDTGMYDAINKGFARASGDVLAWLNSDDMYHPYALQTVARVFGKFANIDWITGIPNAFNESGSRVGFDTFPAAYSRKYLGMGYYDVRYVASGFNWIQQESTFWRRSLWERAGAKLDSGYRYAADFHLWKEFSRHTDLVKVYSFLGGFRGHGNQITADPALYNGELDSIPPPPAGLGFLRRLLHNFPWLRKLFFNRWKGVPLLPLLGLQFPDMTGRTVVWSFRDNDWVVRRRAIV